MTSAFIAAVLAELTREKCNLDEQLKKVNAKIKIAEEEAKTIFAQEGTQSIKTASGATCYLYSTLWASAPEPDALLETPFGYLVKDSVNGQSLSAAIRELPRDDDDMPILPEEVDPESIKITRGYKVGVRLS